MGFLSIFGSFAFTTKNSITNVRVKEDGAKNKIVRQVAGKSDSKTLNEFHHVN